MAERKRFYVYELSDGSRVQYVGKGTGRRLKNQIARTGLFGEIVRRFKTQKAAYAYEVSLIAKLNPPLNKNAGGGGPNTKQRPKRSPKWVRDIEATGTRVFAARGLLRFDLTTYCSADKLAEIKRVALGT